MNHQPYEKWLLNGDPLLPDEEQALRTHLAVCPGCQDLESAWKGVELKLKHAQEIAPAGGFSGRWKERLVVEQQQHQRRQSLVVLTLSLGAAGILALAMINLVYPLWRVPGLVFWTYVYQLFTFSQWLNMLQDLGAAFFTSSSQGIRLAPLWIIFAIGLACELGVLWMISVRKFMNPEESSCRLRSPCCHPPGGKRENRHPHPGPALAFRRCCMAAPGSRKDS